jgi:hypothetical protein
MLSAATFSKTWFFGGNDGTGSRGRPDHQGPSGGKGLGWQPRLLENGSLGVGTQEIARAIALGARTAAKPAAAPMGRRRRAAEVVAWWGTHGQLQSRCPRRLAIGDDDPGGSFGHPVGISRHGGRLRMRWERSAAAQPFSILNSRPSHSIASSSGSYDWPSKAL